MAVVVADSEMTVVVAVVIAVALVVAALAETVTEGIAAVVVLEFEKTVVAAVETAAAVAAAVVVEIVVVVFGKSVHFAAVVVGKKDAVGYFVAVAEIVAEEKSAVNAEQVVCMEILQQYQLRASLLFSFGTKMPLHPSW